MVLFKIVINPFCPSVLVPVWGMLARDRTQTQFHGDPTHVPVCVGGSGQHPPVHRTPEMASAAPQDVQKGSQEKSQPGKGWQHWSRELGVSQRCVDEAHEDTLGLSMVVLVMLDSVILEDLCSLNDSMIPTTNINVFIQV